MVRGRAKVRARNRVGLRARAGFERLLLRLRLLRLLRLLPSRGSRTCTSAPRSARVPEQRGRHRPLLTPPVRRRGEARVGRVPIALTVTVLPLVAAGVVALVDG